MMYEIYGLIRSIGILYIWVIIIASFLSFVRPDPHNPIVQVLYRLTEPTFAFIRKKLPFVVMAGIDLSPLIIIFGLQFIDIIIRNVLFG
ncbi:MAG: YggT family protein [Campylobacterota bacterium]|nr:YggT family protein [Campylobacterota bacterium]